MFTEFTLVYFRKLEEIVKDILPTLMVLKGVEFHFHLYEIGATCNGSRIKYGNHKIEFTTWADFSSLTVHWYVMDELYATWTFTRKGDLIHVDAFHHSDALVVQILDIETKKIRID